MDTEQSALIDQLAQLLQQHHDFYEQHYTTPIWQREIAARPHQWSDRFWELHQQMDAAGLDYQQEVNRLKEKEA